jgi:uncharacterized membrane protein HdeD (DUF308 family)
MSAASPAGLVKHATGLSIAISVLMIVAGLLAIALPFAAGVAANILIGWLLVFGGVAHLVFGWHTRGRGGVLWNVLLGILYLWVGIYLLAHPVRGLLTLTLALAIYLVAEGVMEGVLYFHMRQLPGSGWFLFDAIVTFILGLLVWRTWPASTEWVIGTLIGISILMTGITRLMISLAARHIAGKLA